MSYAVAETGCRHCGTPVAGDGDFCCAGCEFVFSLIHQEGLEQFYLLKGDKTTAPVRARAFEEQGFEWLSALVAEKEGEGDGELRLGVGGLSCVGCVWLIERLFARTEGAVRADVSAAEGAVRLKWEVGKCDLVGFAGELHRFGYVLKKNVGGGGVSERSVVGGKLGLCGAFAMNAMAFTVPKYFGMPDDFAFAGVFALVAAISATLSLLVGGSYFVSRAWAGIRAGTVVLDLPIALGIVMAYAGSVIGWAIGYEGLMYFDFVATFILLMLGGRYLQQVALERSRSRSVATPVAEAVESDGGDEVRVDELVEGTRYWLKPAMPAPVASVLVKSGASVSMDWIDGEPEPRAVKAGGRVGSGAVNVGREAVLVEAEEEWEGSVLEQLVRPSGVDDAGSAPTMEKVVRWYLVTVLVVGTAGGAWWWMRSGDGARALGVMISLFVVSCPCALGVAVPLADDLARQWMERLGVFVRRGGFWGRLKRVKDVVFDKTGTLTTEVPELKNATVLGEMGAEERGVLGALVTGSLHPVCRSLREALGGKVDGGRLTDIEEIPGCGMSATDAGGYVWRLGRRGWATGEGVGTDTVLFRDGREVAAFVFGDSVRTAAKEAVGALAAGRLGVHILSGDSQERVAVIADALGIDGGNAKGNLRPADKVDGVRQIGGERVLFLGDGANDSLAVDESMCSGAAVVDRGVLEERVDFYFVGRSLGFLSELFRTGNRRAVAVRWAFAFAVAYNLVAAWICLAGLMNPLIAAILMPLSSIVTTAIVAGVMRSLKNSGIETSHERV